MIIEIVVYNIESALRAQEGGADRIELCDNSAEGGTTPSYGTIEIVRQQISLDMFVMIRPRGGDFCYSSYEFHAMKRDISACQKLSADGIVFGILLPNGTIDKKRCKNLIEQARPMKVTCHRAFDMTRDPFEALEDCIEAGFDRILTSGGQTKAEEGIELIAELKKAAGTRIAIMPGAGINEHNVARIVALTGVNEIHLSATAFRDSSMEFRNTAVHAMGVVSDAEFKIRTSDVSKIRMIRSITKKGT